MHPVGKWCRGTGAGIFNNGTVTLNECTLSRNIGGGIYNSGTVILNQCTLSENSVDGGGILNETGTATLNQCTLSGNGEYSDSGSGIYNYDGTLGITNTIVAGNIGADIYNDGGYSALNYGGSNLVQSVYNYLGTITGPAPLTNAPDLAPLGNYGGPTQTMPPLPGSPAVGAGSLAANNLLHRPGRLSTNGKRPD